MPPFKQRGESATLSCEYELEGGKLYSVKWYRDHEEFYRFMPKLRPPQRAHSLDGVTVDVRTLLVLKKYLHEFWTLLIACTFSLELFTVAYTSK